MNKAADREFRRVLVVVLGMPIMFSLLLAGGARAASGTVDLVSPTVPTGGTNALTVTDADLDAGDFIIAVINPASTGAARFAANGGQSIVCVAGAACDADGAANSITVQIDGLGTAGIVIVDVRDADGADGLDGTGDDTDITTVAYELVHVVSMNPGRACAHSALAARTGVASSAYSATHCSADVEAD